MASSREPGRAFAGHASTVDETEVARFSALAAEWWDPRGKMAVLHRFNPVRLGFIKQVVCHVIRAPKLADLSLYAKSLQLNPKNLPKRETYCKPRSRAPDSKVTDGVQMGFGDTRVTPPQGRNRVAGL